MNTSITNIRFFRDRWVLTISNAIWSVLSVWDWKSGGHKCGEWSPQGAFFNGPMSLNTQQDANACIAILTSRLDGCSLFLAEYKIISPFASPQHVVLLSLNNDGQLCEIRSIPTSLRPITLHGSLLALCDESSETNVYDFSQDTTIHLGFNSVSPRTNIVDHPIDVIFTSSHVLVVRARSIHLFEYPSSNFVASHTFGWVDSASVTHDPKTNEFSFLIRHQNDNPWTAQLTTLQMYTLSPSRDGTTYDFPPRPRLDIPSPRGTLRCPDVALGRYGTAVWICPRQQTLVVDDAAAGVLSTEILLATVFPGHLTPGGTMAIYTNNLNNWTALDYIEEKGRIVLGSSFGKVIVLELYVRSQLLAQGGANSEISR